jgi:hypothetical protein
MVGNGLNKFSNKHSEVQLNVVSAAILGPPAICERSAWHSCIKEGGIKIVEKRSQTP